MSASELPVVLAEIAAAAGVPAALMLAERHGGTTVYIPGRLPEDHWLVDAVGRVAAEKIVAHFRTGSGGAEILIPIARRAQSKRALTKALENGATAREAARAAGVHERTVHRHRRKRRSDNSSQGKLF